MKNRFSKLLLVLFSICLTGCNNQAGQTQDPSNNTEEENTYPDHGSHCDEDGICYADDHALKYKKGGDSISQPIYMRVGERKIFSVTFDGNPTNEDEKITTWKVDNTNRATLTNVPTKTTSVILTATSAGDVKLTATNNFDKTMTFDYKVTIIDVNPLNSYLWQFESGFGAENAKVYAKFGKNDNNPNGTTSGTANLNGVDWDYSRSAANSIGVEYGGLKLGKSKVPETSISMSANFDRKIKKVTVETSSTNGLAAFSAKIDEDNIYSGYARKYSDDISTKLNFPKIVINVPTAKAGTLSFKWVTPEYDPQADANDFSYVYPGMVVIKSILVEFDDDFSDISADVFDFKTDTSLTALVPAKVGVLEASKTNSKVNFTKIKKADGSSPVQDYALVTGDITMTPASGRKIKAIEYFANPNLTAAGSYSNKATSLNTSLDGNTFVSLGNIDNMTAQCYFNDLMSAVKMSMTGNTYATLYRIVVYTVSAQ